MVIVSCPFSEAAVPSASLNLKMHFQAEAMMLRGLSWTEQGTTKTHKPFLKRLLMLCIAPARIEHRLDPIFIEALIEAADANVEEGPPDERLIVQQSAAILRTHPVLGTWENDHVVTYVDVQEAFAQLVRIAEDHHVKHRLLQEVILDLIRDKILLKTAVHEPTELSASQLKQQSKFSIDVHVVAQIADDYCLIVLGGHSHPWLFDYFSIMQAAERQDIWSQLKKNSAFQSDLAKIVHSRPAVELRYADQTNRAWVQERRKTGEWHAFIPRNSEEGLALDRVLPTITKGEQENNDEIRMDGFMQANLLVQTHKLENTIHNHFYSLILAMFEAYERLSGRLPITTEDIWNHIPIFVREQGKDAFVNASKDPGANEVALLRHLKWDPVTEDSEQELLALYDAIAYVLLERFHQLIPRIGKGLLRGEAIQETALAGIEFLQLHNLEHGIGTSSFSFQEPSHQEGKITPIQSQSPNARVVLRKVFDLLLLPIIVEVLGFIYFLWSTVEYPFKWGDLDKALRGERSVNARNFSKAKGYRLTMVNNKHKNELGHAIIYFEDLVLNVNMANQLPALLDNMLTNLKALHARKVPNRLWRMGMREDVIAWICNPANRDLVRIHFSQLKQVMGIPDSLEKILSDHEKRNGGSSGGSSSGSSSAPPSARTPPSSQWFASQKFNRLAA